jgi:glycopeptide antibiotics resistance protein
MRHILYAACVLFVLGGIAFAAAVTGRRPAAIRATPRSRTPARLDLALFAAVAAIIAVTFVPTHGGIDVHLTPLEDIIGAFTPPLQRSHLLGVAGNVILFAPLGAVLRFRGLPLRKAVLAGAAFSVGIEVTQLLVPGRTTSFDDVLLNALGVVLGHSAGRALDLFAAMKAAQVKAPDDAELGAP